MRAPLPRLPVPCPRCGTVRDLLKAQVSRQQKAGTFTGTCLPCSKLAAARVDASATSRDLEWAQIEPAPEAGSRRRSRFVVYCPRCGLRRTISRSQVRIESHSGTFNLLCPACRR